MSGNHTADGDYLEQDLHDDDNYCAHGVFVGNPFGGDYLCHWCEMGDEPEEDVMEIEDNVMRYAGVREPGDYGGTDFTGRAWEIETPEGRCIVPESVAVAVARDWARGAGGRQ